MAFSWNTQFIQKTTLVFLGTVLTLLSLWFASFFVKPIFFDTFIYNKSTAHGYLVPWEKLDLSSFGDRSQDYITYLKNDLSTLCHPQKQEIIIIGDSFAWGQGVLFRDTFASLLQKSFGDNTQVILLALPGNSLVDYFQIYEKTKLQCSEEFYIFSLTSNDLQPKNNQSFEAGELGFLKVLCEEFELGLNKDIDWMSLTGEHQIDQISEFALNNLRQSWSNQKNICLAKSIFSKFPKKNSIVFFTDSHPISPFINQEWNHWKQMSSLAKTTGLKIYRSSDHLNKATSFGSNNRLSTYSVSDRDKHPSKQAHKLYYQIIYSGIEQSDWLAK